MPINAINKSIQKRLAAQKASKQGGKTLMPTTTPKPKTVVKQVPAKTQGLLGKAKVGLQSRQKKINEALKKNGAY